MLRRLMFVLIGLLLAACASAAPEPSATPTLTPSPTPTATATPFPTPTPRPNVVQLTRASDPAQQAYVSVINGAAAIFDVYIERLAIASNLSFGNYTLPSAIVAGDYVVRVMDQGLRPDEHPPLYESPVQIAGGQTLLLIFTGTPDSLTMSLFPLNLEPLDGDQSRVTVIHAIPSGPEISVQHDGVDLTVPLSFGNAGFPTTLDTDSITLSFVNTPLTYPVNLRERFSHTLVLIGAAADPQTFQIIELAERTPGRAQIRAVNMAAPIGPVDIYLDGDTLAANLDYTRPSDRQVRPARVYTAVVFPAGDDPATSDPLLTSQVNANDNDYLTLIVLGTTDDARLTTYREDWSLTDPRETRIAFVNTVPDVDRIRVSSREGTLTEVGDVGYAQVSLPVDIDAGRYRLTIASVDENQTQTLLEAADDLQFEPGFSYLYLFTGRILDPPVVISDNIGFDPNLVGLDADVIPTATPEIPTRLRLVNALQGGPVLEVSLDGQDVFTGLNYGNTTVLVPTTAGEHQIVIRAADNQQELLNTTITLEIGEAHTAFVYGSGTDPVDLLLVSDAQVERQSGSPRLRLVNLSRFAETSLGLATSKIASAADRLTVFSESPGGATFRRSFAFGIQRIMTARNIASETTSDVVLAPLGPHDIHVTDDDRDQIAASIRGVNFAPGNHYDVVVAQARDTLEISGFVVRYPSD
jgi:hypothetical protein